MSCHWIPVSCHLIPVNCHQNFQIGPKSSLRIGWWDRRKDVPRFVSYHIKYFNEGDELFLSLWKGRRGCLNQDLQERQDKNEGMEGWKKGRMEECGKLWQQNARGVI